MKWTELDAEQCAVARFLSVLGDRWSLLIVSDAFMGVRRFETFRDRLGISRTMLSQRLGDLCDQGVLEKAPYREKPVRYEYRLTPKGRDLYPIIMTMTAWANRHAACEGGPPLRFEHRPCGHDFEPALHCRACGQPAPGPELDVHVRAEAPGVPRVRRVPIVEVDETA